MKYSILSLALLATSVQADVTSVVGPVNQYVNNTIEYVSDSSDYWQTGEETLSREAGDCEDFAILKLEMLADLGVSATLAYGYTDSGIAHMITIVDGFVLDNNTDAVLTLAESSFNMVFEIDVANKTAIVNNKSVPFTKHKLFTDYINR